MEQAPVLRPYSPPHAPCAMSPEVRHSRWGLPHFLASEDFTLV